MTREKLTPPEVARLWGVSHDKVLAWIRSGELRAIDVATKRDGRPQYRIDIEELNAFEQRRMVRPSSPPRRDTNQDKDDGIIEFF
jgi:excisionase family DNA binding protein